MATEPSFSSGNIAKKAENQILFSLVNASLTRCHRSQVLPDIFNRSNFEYSAFSGLKVHSRRRKRKTKGNEKKKKNSIQVGVHEHNPKKGG